MGGKKIKDEDVRRLPERAKHASGIGAELRWLTTWTHTLKLSWQEAAERKKAFAR